MPGNRIARWLIAAASLGLAGCATAPAENRARLVDIPLASTHADLRFALSTGSRVSESCEGDTACKVAAVSDADARFALQVRRIADALENGARRLYPDLAQRVPGLPGGGFDVYVVSGLNPGSNSSANGRIALNSALGTPQPYDDWMAFVIAREMGHVIARHHEENSSAGIATSVILNLLIPGSSLLKTAISAGGSGIAAQSQQEAQAAEADAIAFDLLRAGGFRLRDLYLTLLIEPVVLDDGPWSKSFKASSDKLIAEVRRSEFSVAVSR
jgi:predicted Zn-dependent protease